ncbi:MAG: MBL fold metallo-hydrolase [Verrucomicrobia bacterium]|nr:MBL fold metallo-hydrolase [Verrucomicrobiota bacterium]
MIKPLKKDDELISEINSIPADDPHLHIWWLGQSGFLLKHEGSCLLLDPYLSDSLTQKYALTDKPHVRMTERCLSPERLTGLSVVTASHLHTDHLDAATLIPLSRINSGLQLILPHPIMAEARQRLGDSKIDLIGLDAGEQITVADWQVTGVTAAHNVIQRDESGHCHCIGFVIRRCHFVIYHSGDTLWHKGLLESLPRDCDLMLLPINGNDPMRRVAGNLNGIEAASLAKECSAKLVVPCHYDMFEFNTVTPDDFVAACRKLDQPYRVMSCGDHLVVG